MRILVPLISTLEFVLLAILLATGLSILLYPALLLALLGLILSLRGSGSERGKERKEREEAEAGKLEAALNDNRELRDRLEKTYAEKENLEAGREGNTRVIRDFITQNHRFVCALEAEQKLARVINEKTETATIEMTNHIYSIGDWSKKVEDLIQSVMGQLSSDEVGLRKQAIGLEEELQRIKKLIEVFKVIKNDYIVELERISQTMRAVDTFTGTITDLAERTNVLAINASIEAARAGQAGRGFAVIASEIQGLAGNTMKIAEEISTTIDSSVHTVKDSIGNYGERIESAVSRLAESGDQHALIIEQLGPQIEKVSRVAEESGELSSEVTRNINEVTVHLQYQDSVRQILEHMLQLVEELSRKGKSLADSLGTPDEDEAEAAAEEVRTLLSGMFTTREEWSAFGYDLDEGGDKEAEGEAVTGEEGFRGDVTLF